MFDKHQRKLKRSAQLISVLSKYGFQDLLIRMNWGGKTLSQDSQLVTLSLYERIKLVLEELGPTFVKLGQTFSNRDDLLPQELILELQKLQDNVKTLDLDIREILTSELGINVDEHFEYINETPLAAASIAQVYKGLLKSGEAVIVKVRRPGIDEIIKDDLILLKDLVKIIDAYSDIGDQINLKNAVYAFEKSLLEELSLNNERRNIIQFSQNFKGSTETYVPKVYSELSTDNVLTMEFIDGIKVTDLDALRKNGFSPEKLSEVGYRLFISQILDHGFFHADPHAGNIIVNKDGKLVFIDFGVVGKVQGSDRENLEGLIVNFVSKKPEKIVQNLKRLAVYYNIPDDKRFENEVGEVLNYIHNSSLKEINVTEIFNKMKDVLKTNRLVMPDFFYLLFKGISLIDGVGRTLNPDLDVVASLKPYTRKILFKRLNPEALAKKGLDRAIDFAQSVDELPDVMRKLIQKIDDDQITIQTEIKNTDRIEYLVKSTATNFILALILCANIIATSILWAAGIGPTIGAFSILPFIGILISLGLLLILGMRILRR